MADAWELLAEGAEVLAIHAALLPNGKVLYFGGSEHDKRPASVDATRLWNPATRQVERATFLSRNPSHLLDAPDDLFCCGHCLLPTGNLLVAGGTGKNAILLPDATVLVVGGARSEKGPFGTFAAEKGRGH